MQIQEFIKDTLTQIESAVCETNAQFAQDNHGASVESPSLPIMIDFDLAVENVETDKGEGGAKLQVVQFFNLGGAYSGESVNRQTNRIKFQIPMYLPKPKNTKF